MKKTIQIWKDRNSAFFTYRKYRKPQCDYKPQQYHDDGYCEVCKKRGRDVLIHEAFPHICKCCYDTVRAYKECRDIADKLVLKKKRDITLKEMQKVVAFMDGLAKFEHVPAAIFVGGIIAGLAKGRK